MISFLDCQVITHGDLQVTITARKKLRSGRRIVKTHIIRRNSDFKDLCPVRAFIALRDHPGSTRRPRRKLLVNSNDPSKPLRTTTISTWLRRIVSMSTSQKPVPSVRSLAQIWRSLEEFPGRCGDNGQLVLPFSLRQSLRETKTPKAKHYQFRPSALRISKAIRWSSISRLMFGSPKDFTNCLENFQFDRKIMVQSGGLNKHEPRDLPPYPPFGSRDDRCYIE